ncbi:MAG: c-type cytochrome [Planctomycetales bacterium]|nr:c-type cytochrome [Planctomycetales bacterium]
MILVVSCAALSAIACGAEPQRDFSQAPQVVASEAADGSSTPAGPVVEQGDSRWQTEGPKPDWIWAKEAGEQFAFRKSFAVDGQVKQARLIASGDNEAKVFVNDRRVAASGDWNDPATADVGGYINNGENQLRIEGKNSGGPAGVVLKLEITKADGKREYVLTDATWQAAANKKKGDWGPVVALQKLGGQPWGDVFSNTKLPQGDQDTFQVQPGFQVEKLFDVPKEELGSWVSITFDNKGRLLACDQGNQGVCRITLPKPGSDEPTKVERLDVKITSAQGMLYAFDSLYLSVNGGPGSGFYRARDTNGDDQYDEVTKLASFSGGGEHGPHALRLSPDGKSIYVVCGNHTNPPDEITASRIPTNWNEDLLLPRQWDARGHARGRLAPGGWVAKTDPDGKTWEIISIGYRNSYDMDFNAEGELFVYDADMEWDMGSPWYRPTRAVHAASGSEFGWRSGTGKWPTYYVDSLPPVVNIGPGSPTGVCFGTGAKFPAKYQRALYLTDWTFGTIYAIHLAPSGASYTGEKQEFVARAALPLTDVEIGPDGAMYFTVGGRGTQSALYRVTYVGKESTAADDGKDAVGADLRALRHKLEAFHGQADPKSLDLIWPALGHEDRSVRYAARVALEFQDGQLWHAKAIAERDPQTSITALVALARQGHADQLSGVLAALERIDYGKLPRQQRLELLRCYSLAFIRLGRPDQAVANGITARLDSFFPADNDGENRELCNVLVYLDSPTIIGKCLDLLEKTEDTSSDWSSDLLARNSGYGGTIAKILANAPEIQKIHYAFALRNMRYGWTIEQRKRYFTWLDGAKQRSGGASYVGFLENIRKEAYDNMSPAEKVALESEIPAAPPKVEELPKPQGPGREWLLEEVAALAAKGLHERDFENGKRTFAAAQCVACHRFDGAGGATGPDLTNVAGRFSPLDLADSMINPSKVVSDQYRASTIVTEDGRVLTGRIINEVDGKYTILADPIDATKIVELQRSEIDQITPSKVSLMPAKVLNQLNSDEVLDLLAYLLSRGNPDDRMFQKPSN